MEYIMSNIPTVVALALSLLNLGILFTYMAKNSQIVDRIDYEVNRLALSLQGQVDDLNKEVRAKEEQYETGYKNFLRHNLDYRTKTGVWKDSLTKRVESLESYRAKEQKKQRVMAAKKKEMQANRGKKQPYNKNNANRPNTGYVKKKPNYQVDKNGFKKMN